MVLPTSVELQYFKSITKLVFKITNCFNSGKDPQSVERRDQAFKIYWLISFLMLVQEFGDTPI